MMWDWYLEIMRLALMYEACEHINTYAKDSYELLNQYVFHWYWVPLHRRGHDNLKVPWALLKTHKSMG